MKQILTNLGDKLSYEEAANMLDMKLNVTNGRSEDQNSDNKRSADVCYKSKYHNTLAGVKFHCRANHIFEVETKNCISLFYSCIQLCYILRERKAV